MIITLPATTFSAGALALVFLWLTVLVFRARMASGTSLGDGGNETLQRAIRAHANFTEWVPLTLILLALTEYQLGTTVFTWGAGLLLIVARIGHGFGLNRHAGRSIGRAFGTLANLVVLALIAFALLFQSLVRYL